VIKIGPAFGLLSLLVVGGCQGASVPPASPRAATVVHATAPEQSPAVPGGHVEFESSSKVLRPPRVPTSGEAPPAVWFATPDGWSGFTVHDVDGTATINGGFDYTVGLKVSEPGLDETTLLGQLVTVGIQLDKERRRYLNGHVTSVSRDPGESADTFRVQIEPWTALLSRTANCMVFERAGAAGILRRVFDRYAFASYRVSLGGSYPVFDFFAQYRETDLNLIKRVVEDAGVTTFFEHEATRHTLVLVDGPHGYPRMVPTATLQLGTEVGNLRDVQSSWALRATRYRLRASDVRESEVVFESTGQTPRAHGRNPLEIYDFEQGPRNQRDLDFYAQLRAEEEESRARTLWGVLDDVARAGMSFTLAGHPAPAWNGSYLVVSSQLRVRMSSTGDVSARSSIGAAPLDSPYRPSRRTAVPVINGPQLATVVAAGGEARDGHLKVRFHWSARTPDQEVWLPMTRTLSSEPAPAPGSQVLVQFLEGDASRPLVTDVLQRRPAP
jgi:type VI secretion system secreted protein VgrG